MTPAMIRTPSVMSLHLRYRLWIAEMNFYINDLRIFDDYLKELTDKQKEPKVKAGIDYFEKQFIKIREEIDELRHEMHILKMKLAAYAKEGKPLDYKTYQGDHHTVLKQRYSNFRKAFDKVKSEFIEFEGKWLN